MMKTRVFSLILSALLLASAMTACAGGGGADTTAPAGTTAAPVETTAPPETEPVEVRDTADLPEDLDMSGYTLRILQPEKHNYSLIASAPEDLTGETLNDTLYNRNVRLEQKYGFKVQEVHAAKIQQTFINAVLSSSNDFDMAYNSINGMAQLILNGQAADLNTMEYIDLSKNYWDQNAVRDLSISGKTYYAIGDINLTDDESMMVMLYNTALGNEIGVEDLYKAVEEGRWTYDLLLKYVKQATNDVDGNGVLDGSDVIGYFYNAGNSFFPHAAAMELNFFPLDQDGTITFNSNVERAQKVFDIINQLHDPATSFDWGTIKGGADQASFITAMMSNKQAMFQNMILSQLRRLYPEVDGNFGVLPMPKLNEAEENYYTTVYRTYTFVVSVPISNPDMARTGYAIEAMADASGDLFDAYYEICMGAKYIRDPQSYEMIKISSESRVYDPGYCYDWGKLYSTLNNSAKSRTESVASVIETIASVAETAMKDYVDTVKQHN